MPVALAAVLRGRHAVDGVTRDVDGTALTNHRHLDLARVLELVLDLPRDLVREQDRLVVVDLGRLDDDANLAPCLQGVDLLDAAVVRRQPLPYAESKVSM